MRDVSADLDAAIESAERVVWHRVQVAWDGGEPAGAGTLDDITEHVATAKVTQTLASNLPDSARAVAGAAAAQLDLALGRGNVVRRPVGVEFRSFTSNTTGASRSHTITIDRPGGAVAGEVILVTLCAVNANAVFRTQTSNVSWTVLGWRSDRANDNDNVEAMLLTRRVVAGEPSTYTFDLNGVDVAWCAVALCIAGAGALGVHEYAAGRYGQPDVAYSTLETEEITTTLDDCVIVASFCGLADGTIDWSAGGTDVLRSEIRSSVAGVDDATIMMSSTAAPVPAGSYTMSGIRTDTGTIGVTFIVAVAPAVAGDDSQHAAWTFSELNAAGPFAGKPRFTRPCRWEVGFATESGIEYVPLFNGLTLTSGASARGRRAVMSALDGRERMRTPVPSLPAVAAELPYNPLSAEPSYPGLTTTWFVSWAFFHALQQRGGYLTHPEQVGPAWGSGFFAAPNPRPGCALYAPMHGSVEPFVGDLLYAYAYTGLGAKRRVKFADGPYVAATEPAPYAGGINAGWTPNGGSRNGVFFNASTQTAGRIEFCVRFAYDSGGALEFHLYGPNHATRDLKVSIQQGSTLALNIIAAGVTRAVPGPTVPTDGDWHWYAVGWDSTANAAQFAIDGVETTGTITAWSNVIAADYMDTTLEVAMIRGVQLAEVHADPGMSVDWTGQGLSTDLVSILVPWIFEDWTASAYIDRSGNEIDATPTADFGDVWEVPSSIAAGEFGAIYFDPDGRPHYRNQRSDVSTAGQTVVRTLRSTDALRDLDYTSGLASLRNSIRVAYQGVEFHIGATLYQASGVLRVPALSTLTITTRLQGQIWGTAPTVSAIEANTLADGSGTPVFPDWTVTASWADGLVVEVANTEVVDVFLVDTSGQARLIVTGDYWAPSSVPGQPAQADDVASQRRYRVQPLDVGASPWMQRYDSAASLALYLAGDLADPRPVIKEVPIPGDPRLEQGDLVQIVDRDGLGVDGAYRIFGLTSTGDTAGAFGMTLSVRSGQTVAEWDVSSWDGPDVWGA